MRNLFKMLKIDIFFKSGKTQSLETPTITEKISNQINEKLRRGIILKTDLFFLQREIWVKLE